jgi:membrane-bound ClpP family serine protease
MGIEPEGILGIFALLIVVYALCSKSFVYTFPMFWLFYLVFLVLISHKRVTAGIVGLIICFVLQIIVGRWFYNYPKPNKEEHRAENAD